MLNEPSPKEALVAPKKPARTLLRLKTTSASFVEPKKLVAAFTAFPVSDQLFPAVAAYQLATPLASEVSTFPSA